MASWHSTFCWKSCLASHPGCRRPGSGRGGGGGGPNVLFPLSLCWAQCSIPGVSIGCGGGRGGGGGGGELRNIGENEALPAERRGKTCQDLKHLIYRTWAAQARYIRCFKSWGFVQLWLAGKAHFVWKIAFPVIQGVGRPGSGGGGGGRGGGGGGGNEGISGKIRRYLQNGKEKHVRI